MSSLEYLREFNLTSVIIRLVLALVSGEVIGFGRSQKHCNAGMRTYMLTSIGAALTILISMYEYQMLCEQWAFAAEYSEIKFDGTRFSAQVINGIGFLAAGTIIGISHQQVSGLTTAIGLFAAVCLGIAAGSGFYECVIISDILIIISMEVLQPLEIAFKRKLRYITLFVEFDSIDDFDVIKRTIAEEGAHIFDADIENSKREIDKFPSAIITIRLSDEKPSHSQMLSTVAVLNCVYSVQELIS